VIGDCDGVVVSPCASGGDGVAAPAQLMFSYERYFNSNNFSATIVETGLSIAF